MNPAQTGFAAELRQRAQLFAQALDREGISLALVQQAADKYYLAGTVQQGFLAVASGHDPVFFCRKGAERARQETPWQVVDMPRPRELPGLLKDAGFAGPETLGFEADVLPVQLFEQLQRLFPDAAFRDASALLRRQRMVKTEFELEELRAAGAIWAGMMAEAERSIRPGSDAYLVSVALDAHGRGLGGQGLVRTRGFNFEYFAPHVLVGAPGAVPAAFDGPTGGLGPHPSLGQGSAREPIAAGEPVLVDIAVGVRGYVADGTRTFVAGSLPPELQRACALSVELLAEAEAALRPGITVGSLFSRARQRAEAEGLLEQFMGFGPDRVHFLGHGVGLELDELPVLTERNPDVFAAGMVVAVEPKFVFPGIGAVGVEDTFAVRAAGSPEVLTRFARGPIQLSARGA